MLLCEKPAVCGDEKPNLGSGTYLVETTFFQHETRFDSVRPNERSPPVGQRAIDDSFRRRDVSGWASVYRKQVDENSDYPNRSSVHAVDKPSVKKLCGPWSRSSNRAVPSMEPNANLPNCLPSPVSKS
jgi:hypothetical protein